MAVVNNDAGCGCSSDAIGDEEEVVAVVIHFTRYPSYIGAAIDPKKRVAIATTTTIQQVKS